MDRNGIEFKSREEPDEIIVQEYPGATHTALTALRAYKQVEQMVDHELCDYVEMV